MATAKSSVAARAAPGGGAAGVDSHTTPNNAPAPLTDGSGTTTIDGDTQHSATNPRSPEPTCSGLTSRLLPRGGRGAQGCRFGGRRRTGHSPALQGESRVGRVRGPRGRDAR